MITENTFTHTLTAREWQTSEIQTAQQTRLHSSPSPPISFSLFSDQRAPMMVFVLRVFATLSLCLEFSVSHGNRTCWWSAKRVPEPQNCCCWWQRRWQGKTFLLQTTIDDDQHTRLTVSLRGCADSVALEICPWHLLRCAGKLPRHLHFNAMWDTCMFTVMTCKRIVWFHTILPVAPLADTILKDTWMYVQTCMCVCVYT